MVKRSAQISPSYTASRTIMQIIPAVAALALSSGVASATTHSNNPFAPKVSARTRRSAYVGSLLAHARPTANSRLGRRLEDEEQDVDISGYSVKFEKCQYIKQYADERDEDVDNVLETKRFVIFRLCPADDCASGCEDGYGEYLVDMATYLEATLEHKQDAQERYCEACEECADDDAADDDGADDDAARRRRRLVDVDCGSCYGQCQNIANMEENGYADAAEYVDCEKVYENDDTGVAYYAGAICTNDGARMKVGLYTDEDCSIYDSSLAVDQYLKNENGYNVKLSYHLLKQTFAADECIASCTQVDDDDGDDGDDGDDDQEAAAETAEVCENLYAAAGKCETPYGFASGMDYSASEYYDVQTANEEAVCDFIATIQSGNFDQTGEVVVTGGQTILSSGVQTTGGQKFALTFFAIGTVGLAAYAAVLHSKITRRTTQPSLSTQDTGGHLA